MEVSREIEFPVPPDEVWEALTDPDQLEEWFANDVELDPREGGAGVFRWEDGEERHATVVVAEPPERLVLDWDDEGETEFTLEETEEGTKLHVRESTPEFSTALELRALAMSRGRLCAASAIQPSVLTVARAKPAQPPTRRRRVGAWLTQA
jgi:uncharacterized protein YndB with AHSA1/START domain